MDENFVKTSLNNWNNYTFLFPCVSVGNVGQLATDLLIATIPDIKKSGYLINNRLVQPIVGYDPYDRESNELSVSVELYESVQLNLVIMQQRSPLFRGKRNEFVKLLTDFIEIENFKETICLTSSYAYERLDSQLIGNQCRYLTTGVTDTEIDELLNQLNWLHLEKRNDHGNYRGREIKSCEQIKRNLNSYIPGGGIAQKFYKACEEANITSKILIIFASEGENIPESYALLNYLNEWKHYLQKVEMLNWRTPVSWDYLF